MDAVDKLKYDLCNFARTKMNANYADCMSLMNIVEKYNFEVGEFCGVRVNCLTAHNRVLTIRYNPTLHTCEEVNAMVENMNKSIKDNTISVVCIPDDVTVKCMTPGSFQQLIIRLLEMYQTREQRVHDRWIWLDGQDEFALRVSMEGVGLLDIPPRGGDRR